MDQLDRIDPRERRSAQIALGYMEHNLESNQSARKGGRIGSLGRTGT
jgi:hypothetical protein